MINTHFVSDLNSGCRRAVAFNDSADAALNTFNEKVRIRHENSSGNGNVFTRSYNFVCKTFSDITWNSIYAFMWRNKYYFVFGGVLCVGGLIIFTSSGVKIVNFFKSHSVNVTIPTGRTLPLNNLNDSEAIAKMTKELLEKAEQLPILGARDYFFDNFVHYSSKIDAIFLFLSNHLQ
jgi:hypothetical protein